MAIFGRITARQRLRRATRESLAIPAFSSPIDCTPWVTGGLWPAELSPVTAETAALAEYLKTDLQRISNGANEQIKMIKRAGLPDFARQAEEARVVDEARARAARRVESAVRDLHAVKAGGLPDYSRQPDGGHLAGPDLDTTQVIPAVTPVEPPVEEPAESAHDTLGPTESEHNDAPAAVGDDDPDDSGARHTASGAPTDDNGDKPTITPESGAAIPAAPPAGIDTESASERLQRLLAFVVRQEPRLRWAIGDCTDGTTVLVTDLAHGWIPPDITLPAGVRLLGPGRRGGKVPALVGDATRVVTYTPGDPVGRPTDFAATEPSVEPRELPVIDDLGWELGRATHWRDGLPRMAHTLAKAAAGGTGVVDEEADVLRVHLDTARYQLLHQYPDVEPALLLNCLLLAATEACVAGDSVSANYHLAWFRKLCEPPRSQWAAKP
ncbi:MAG: DUF5631 domain-containing protein [Mycobacterium sp.]|uniref:DUF5631 domain-containing protein n=1 Tax=Mycobacterium sp. TaxID=1785 RepID=UPI003F9AF4E5